MLREDTRPCPIPSRRLALLWLPTIRRLRDCRSTGPERDGGPPVRETGRPCGRAGARCLSFGPQGEAGDGVVRAICSPLIPGCQVLRRLCGEGELREEARNRRALARVNVLPWRCLRKHAPFCRARRRTQRAGMLDSTLRWRCPERDRSRQARALCLGPFAVLRAPDNPPRARSSSCGRCGPPSGPKGSLRACLRRA